MFLFKKLITPFLLPPGILIGLLAILALWSLRRRDRRAAAICLAACGLLGFFSSGLVANWMMTRLESGLQLPTAVKADAIIMLGGGVYDGSPDLSGTGAPGPETMQRLVTAARLNRRFLLPIIIAGGKVFEHSGSIAHVAQRFLRDLGVDPNHIFLEDRSRDTFENARYSAAICQRRGFTRPLLVTSGYHMKRALIAFESTDLSVTPYPCALTTWQGKRLNAWHALPSATALKINSTALHEWLGIVYYKWRY